MKPSAHFLELLVLSASLFVLDEMLNLCRLFETRYFNYTNNEI